MVGSRVRLHDIRFPIAAIGPQYLFGPIVDVSWFENHKVEAVMAGLFDDFAILDANGKEYVVSEIKVQTAKGILGYFKGQGMRIEMDLDEVRQHTTSSFRERLLNTVTSNPDWEFGDQGVWSEVDLNRSFPAGSDIPDVIESVGWYSVPSEKFLEPVGKSKVAKKV